jgi:predicted GH43/DUF377 family glycosyl hydrolase
MNQLQIKSFIQPVVPYNDFSTTQKNHVMFEHDGKLFSVYKCDPHQVYELNEGKIIELHETPGVKWHYGEARGGTRPVPHEGKLLRFFHSSTRTGIGRVEHRYYIGAYLMEAHPPFAVLKVSKCPVIFGSEVDGLRPDNRKACDFWKENVVFVSGIIERKGHWLLSVGVNDSSMELVKVTAKDLNL